MHELSESARIELAAQILKWTDGSLDLQDRIEEVARIRLSDCPLCSPPTWDWVLLLLGYEKAKDPGADGIHDFGIGDQLGIWSKKHGEPKSAKQWRAFATFLARRIQVVCGKAEKNRTKKARRP